MITPTLNPLRRKHTRKPASVFLLLTALFVLIMGVNSCGVSTIGDPTVTPTLTVTPTFRPTISPTPAPLGVPENPFVIGLFSETGDPEISAAAAELALRVSTETGKSVRGIVYTTWESLLTDMSQKTVHAAWMPPMTYLFASERDLAQVALLTNHFGVYMYGSQYLAHVETNLTPYYDPISSFNAAEADVALFQMQDLRPCWVDPGSVSGYIVPAGLLALNGVTMPPAVWTQEHTAVVRSLYIKGICDFGATFAISGDPRTASVVQGDLPDVMNKVLVLWRSDAVIPNLNLSLSTAVSEFDRQALTNAFLNIGETEEGRALLSLSAGYYQIDEVRAVNDDLYDPLREISAALDVDLRDLLGK